MSHAPLVLAGSLFLFVGSLAAQTTWVVGGAGAQFANIGPAVAAAAPGDVILVRAGVYSEPALDIDKGLTILAEAGVEYRFFGPMVIGPGVLVHDLPAEQSFTLRGGRFGLTLSSPNVRATDCSGLVLVEGLAGVPSLANQGTLYTDFTDCEQVHVHGCTGPEGRIGFVRSRAVVTHTAMENAASAMVATDSDVTLDRCTLRALSGFGTFPPLSLTGGVVRLARSTVEVPSGIPFAASAVSAMANPTIWLDPTAALIPSPGLPQVSGAANVRNAEGVSLARTTTPGAVTFELLGRTQAVFATVVSLPTGIVALPWGAVWINLADQAQVPIDVGLLGQRQHDLTLDTGWLPSGLVIVAQVAVLDAELTLTNGVGYVVP